MIGRDRELAELVAGLDEAVEGRGGLWLVSGEPGIGKSRLAEEIADLAEERGMAAHWGRSWEAGGAPAFWPWIQVIRSILAVEGAVDSTPERVAAQLAQILPELADRLPDGGGPPQLEPDQALFALMDAVVAVLRIAGSSSPAVLLLEDLHAADPASITLLDFVSRQLRSTPVVIVGNYREMEARREGVGEGLAAITRGVRTLRLGSLGIDEVAACVREIAGTDPGPRATAAIHEASEGNPLYVVEIAGLMLSRGELDEVGDRVDIAIPDSVTAVIRERIAALDETTRERLEAAAVIGREFRSSELAELLEADVGEVESSLSGAVTARIIDQVGIDCHRFVHFLIREVFLSSLTARRRRVLHARRADLLEAAATQGREVAWSEVAHHLLEAGPECDDRALGACVRAAETAAAQLAFDDAAELFERALTVADRVADVDLRFRCVLLLKRAQAVLKSGNVGAGREICREAARAARQLEDEELYAQAALTYGSVFVYADVDSTLVDHLQEALAVLDTGDSALRARLQARLAAAMQPADDPDEAMDLAREAIAMARRIDDRETLLHAIRAGCSALMDVADPSERLALNREHVALADELGQPFEGLRGYLRLVIDSLDLGDLESADAAITAYDRLASQTQLPHHLWPVASFRAMRAMMEGRFDEAVGFIDAAEGQAERFHDPNAERTTIIQRIGLARTKESFGQMRAEAEAAGVELTPTGFTGLFLRILQVSNLARMECPEEAPEATVEQLIDSVVTSRDRDRSILCPAAEIVAACGLLEAAEALCERLQPYSEHWLTWGLYGMVCEGPVSRHLALLESRLGKIEEARHHFEHALERTRRFGLRPMTARISYEFARHLAEGGEDRERVGALLAESEEIARDFGQDGLLELVLSMGAEAGESTIDSADGGQKILPSVDTFELDRDGELWVCRCGEDCFNLKNTKGVRILARLVSEPGREIHVLELSGETPVVEIVDIGDAGEVLDSTARAQYQRRVEELKAEVEEAEGFNDPGRVARARDELEIIAAELSKAFGLGGRNRRAGAAAERARVNVQRRLRDAVKRIAEHSPTAGRHLDWALKTGMFCRYDPS